MLITAIEPRRKAMSALYLDGEYVMNLDTRTLIENRFDVGKDIDDEDDDEDDDKNDDAEVELESRIRKLDRRLYRRG